MTERASEEDPPPRRGPEPVEREPLEGPALMLAGGGARAAYQVGILSYIGRRIPDLRVRILTGVSAGGINVGFLASHPGDFGEATEALRRKWCSLTTEEVFRSDPWSLLGIAVRWGAALLSGGARLAPRARSLVDTEPLRRFLRRSFDSRTIERKVADGRLRAVAVSALSYQTGRTVSFVHGHLPAASWHRHTHRAVQVRLSVEHVMASAAIPILFPAVKVGQQYYGDGSFRYVAPLDPAIQLGADRVLAISARYPQHEDELRRPQVLGYPPPVRILGLLFNSVFLDTLEDDVRRLERVNALLERIPEERRGDLAYRPVDLLVLQPSRDIGRLAAGYEGRLPRTLRFFVRGLGSPATRNADFLSYFLFESAYISRLIELGIEDAKEQWPRIEAWLKAIREEDGSRAARRREEDGSGEEGIREEVRRRSTGPA